MNHMSTQAKAALSIKEPKFNIPKTSEPCFRIFRSTSSRRLFAVHLTDSKENSLGILKDLLTFEEAQECMLQYEKITNVIEIEEVTEVVTS